MCVLLTAHKTSRGEKKRRINRGCIIPSLFLLMKKKAEPKRKVPTGIIF
jgi:hypothetical protein